MATVTLTVQFDTYAWNAASPEARQEWLDRVVDQINEEAYVSEICIEQSPQVTPQPHASNHVDRSNNSTTAPER